MTLAKLKLLSSLWDYRHVERLSTPQKTRMRIRVSRGQKGRRVEKDRV